MKAVENPMPRQVAIAYLMTGTAKQSGRKYGPRPLATRAQRTLEPLTNDAREAAYRRQSGRRVRPADPRAHLGAPQEYARMAGLTPRQRRRSWHKELTAARRVGIGEMVRAAGVTPGVPA